MKSAFSWWRALVWVLIVVGYAVASKNYLFDFAATLQVESIKAQIGILVNVSAILFGVIGAWLALIYPSALIKVQGKDSVDLAYSGVDLSVLKSLVFVLLFSTASLILSLLSDLMLTLADHPIISGLLCKEYVIASCAILVWFLFIVQIAALGTLLVSSFELVFDLFISRAYGELERLLGRKKSE
ncbi:hypothetical protein [Shewanella sp. FJAT-52076]|uniref:hypothetical protein n=1 Tax=Shewanella sp. FJAT-52076 TaxID=2864202 RepID=UPI001C65BFB8|nr:hypothetical protein [Shewanella sp. FJAT-52076]QYJ74646.1 hypothetical protein K0H79_15010 [Shewanella sp. FJAT-52076]